MRWYLFMVVCAWGLAGWMGYMGVARVQNALLAGRAPLDREQLRSGRRLGRPVRLSRHVPLRTCWRAIPGSKLPEARQALSRHRGGRPPQPLVPKRVASGVLC